MSRLLNWLLEWLWPPLRLERYCREEDAKCRVWMAVQREKLHKSETNAALKRFDEPSVFTKILNKEKYGRDND